ncbi:class I SAM-dependent methyltransferase [Shimia sediminis]|uniref:class I SAM-dependent methyltransferase n=1 Tax=Shimia sediminis TaxID=2497945 RepID=UPI000F8C54E4|nr:class I SAM-dependent methyltransferase [Shimia sediminis]
MRTDANFWTKIAPKYARNDIRDMEAYEYTLGRTRSYLRDTDSVLEVGCGTGSTALLLAPSVARITASDFAEGMLEIGRDKARTQGVDNITFANIDVADPALDQSYDAILGFNLFHLIRDLDASLADVHKALKPGGMFISKTPCLAQGGLGFKFGLLKLMIPLMQLLGKAPFVKMLTIQELETAVTNAGFEIIESGNFPAKPPSRYLVARRK